MDEEKRQFREELLNKMRTNKEVVQQWIREGEKKWKENMRIKREREKRELRYLLTMQETKRRIKEFQTLQTRNDVYKGIEEFERTLQRYSVSKRATQESADLDDPKIRKQEALKYMKTIKAKKQEENIARKDRDQRRRKLLIDQQRVYQEIEEKRRIAIILEKIQKKSQEERKLAQK